MSFKVAQVSLEYLIITGFVVVAILIPAFLILFSSTNSGVQNSISFQKNIDLGKGLTNDAKQMYYLGIYSRKISVYDIPENIRHIFLLQIMKEDKNYYYIGIAALDGKKISVQTFLSDVPLTSDAENRVTDDSMHHYIDECSEAGYVCEFYSFRESSIQPGQRKFKIETVWQEGNIETSIVPVLT